MYIGEIGASFSKMDVLQKT